MIDHTPENQLSIFDFETPFNACLSTNNRWVKLSEIVPWDEFAKLYHKKMDAKQGRPALPARMVLGALIIKHLEGLSDEKTIQSIQENIYMQFFVGLRAFKSDKIFDSSLFVSIRKRLGKDVYDGLNHFLCQDFDDKHAPKKKRNPNPDKLTNKGKMQCDATVADQYITYPTDANLLNTAREKLDEIIDAIYLYLDKKITKPRTYKRVLSRAFLNYSKKKNKSESTHRKMIRKLLESVNRNLDFVDKLMPDPTDLIMGKEYPLSQKDLDVIEVIRKLYDQQKTMYDTKARSCKDRIVSLHQSHVRPIVRGKQGRRVEFGAKLNVSLDNGFAFVDTHSWDAFNEGQHLNQQVESYKERHGYYPELVQVDKIYTTLENRKWLKERNIRVTAAPLGRKPKKKPTAYQRQKRKKEATERNHIEGKFGQAKNAYGLNKIRARRKETSESWVNCIFFVMNLLNYQKKASFGRLLQHLLFQISLIFAKIKRFTFDLHLPKTVHQKIPVLG